jgi:hypothetical protein
LRATEMIPEARPAQARESTSFFAVPEPIG